jgi:hypothetical protein
MELLARHKSGIKRMRQNKTSEILHETESNISLYYLNCNHCTIIIPNKVIKIFFENCNNCTISISHSVTPIEILRMKSCHFTIDNCNLIQIDLSQSISIDLININYDFYTVYCKTWDIIINIPNKQQHYELFNDYFGEQFVTGTMLQGDLIEFHTMRI